MSFSRKLFALVCLVAVLWVALHPLPSGEVWAFLAPWLVFIALAVATAMVRQPERISLPASPFLAVSSSRAPPLA